MGLHWVQLGGSFGEVLLRVHQGRRKQGFEVRGWSPKTLVGYGLKQIGFGRAPLPLSPFNAVGPHDIVRARPGASVEP